MIFPWQTNEWQQLCKLHERQILPHALLLTGPKDIGKGHLALEFAKFVLCPTHFNHEGFCKSCHWVTQSVHPNLKILPDSGIIKIDYIRDIIEFINQSALEPGYQIVLIPNAQQMNLNAANALLKTLEEPKAAVLFILTASEWGRLPATVRSRCQRIAFPLPQRKIALEWLQTSFNTLESKHLDLYQGAPLAVHNAMNANKINFYDEFYENLFLLKQQQLDPLDFAMKLKEEEPLQILNGIILWLMDVVKVKLNFSLENVEWQAKMKKIAEHHGLPNLVARIDNCQYLRNQLISGINLNKQLLFEKILLAL